MIERGPSAATAQTLARNGTRWATKPWERPCRARKATRRPASVPTVIERRRRAERCVDRQLLGVVEELVEPGPTEHRDLDTEGCGT